MLNTGFLSTKSTFFEKLLEHRFLFDIGSELVLRPNPQFLNVLKSEVDAFGFDLVLAVANRAIHVQMKTRSGKPLRKPYVLSDELWTLPDACAIWMLYKPQTLEPSEYYLLGLPMPPIHNFSPERTGFRKVKMQQANHKHLTLKQLSAVLFP